MFQWKMTFSGGVGYEERRNQKYLGQEAVFGANGYIYFGSAYFFCMEKAVLTVNSLWSAATRQTRFIIKVKNIEKKSYKYCNVPIEIFWTGQKYNIHNLVKCTSLNNGLFWSV